MTSTVITSPRWAQARQVFVMIRCDNSSLNLFNYARSHHNLQAFKCKQPVKVKEREAILRLFPQPSASQSWRKVLSMGNLLNGHEPLTREIIFSAHDQSGRNLVPKNSSEELETHRMYVHGTSNDLQVALAVASWD